MNATDPSPTRTAPLALWRVAQAFLGVLHVLFGDPQAVATRHTLTAKAHGFMAAWLRSAEAMLRRLLVIEASAIAKPNTRPLLKPRRTRQPKLMHFWPEHPEKWRVSFRVMDRRRPRRPTPAPAGEAPAVHKRRKRLSREERWCSEYWPKPKFRSAWPLAERYEALLRVFNDPAPYARRLAARLHATPHRLAEALRAPPDACDRVDRFDDLGECAKQAWRPFLSSA